MANWEKVVTGQRYYFHHISGRYGLRQGFLSIIHSSEGAPWSSGSASLIEHEDIPLCAFNCPAELDGCKLMRVRMQGATTSLVSLDIGNTFNVSIMKETGSVDGDVAGTEAWSEIGSVVNTPVINHLYKDTIAINSLSGETFNTDDNCHIMVKVEHDTASSTLYYNMSFVLIFEID